MAVAPTERSLMYGRHSTEVIGYTWFADLYCAPCGKDLAEIDPEGNPKHPIFLDQDWEIKGHHCGQCGSSTNEW
jgi:hypothetical protein